ncbi:MAG: hypothetical protein AABX98_05190, partial [Nanoarchaeota archaeon]
MDKNTVMVIAMVVLFLFAAVQSVQLTSLKKQLVESDFTTGSGSSGITTAASGSSSSGSSSGSTASS